MLLIISIINWLVNNRVETWLKCITWKKYPGFQL